MIAEPADTLIGDLPRSRPGEVLRVQRRHYKGRVFLDLRIFFANEAGELCPTGKGVTVPPDQVGALVELLERAK